MNSTGTCFARGFVCANDEVIPHSKRCDRVEDCADGTDEYLCEGDHTPLWERTAEERDAVVEASCIKCTCLKGSVTVTSTHPWWSPAKTAPRDFTMMTDAPAQQNMPCNPATVTSIKLNVYKKQNKGCRGWVCCIRQEQCVTCSSGTTASHCY